MITNMNRIKSITLAALILAGSGCSPQIMGDGPYIFKNHVQRPEIRSEEDWRKLYNSFKIDGASRIVIRQDEYQIFEEALYISNEEARNELAKPEFQRYDFLNRENPTIKEKMFIEYHKKK